MSNSGFVRTAETSVEPRFVAKKRANFIDKKTASLYHIRLIPLVEGYEPRPVGYHIETAVIKIRGKDRVWRVRTTCHGYTCKKCEESRAFWGKGKIPYEKKEQKGQFFMAYVVYPNIASGTFDFGQKQEPFLFEHKYRWLKTQKNGKDAFLQVSEDWENFMDAFTEATKAGFDPTDAENGNVFQVSFKKVPVGDTGNLKDTFLYTALTDVKVKVPLPANWRKTVEEFYPITELYLDLSDNDMKILLETTAGIKAIQNDPGLEQEQKDKAADALYENYRTIINVDFKNILEGMEKKKEEGQTEGQGSQGNIASEFDSSSSYTVGAKQSLAGNVPAQGAAPAASTAPASPPPQAPQVAMGAGTPKPADATVTPAQSAPAAEGTAAADAVARPFADKFAELRDKMKKEKKG